MIRLNKIRHLTLNQRTKFSGQVWRIWAIKWSHFLETRCWLISRSCRKICTSCRVSCCNSIYFSCYCCVCKIYFQYLITNRNNIQRIWNCSYTNKSRGSSIDIWNCSNVNSVYRNFTCCIINCSRCCILVYSYSSYKIKCSDISWSIIIKKYFVSCIPTNLESCWRNYWEMS